MTQALDITTIRAQFPALNQIMNGSAPVFLDGPGGTQVPQSVLNAMVDYLGKSNSNLLNSDFFAVKRTHEVVRTARENAAALLNAEKPSEIVFGANMTTLTAHISRSIARNWQAGDEIIVTDLDHYANVSFWKQIAVDKGVRVRTVRVKPEACTLDYDHLESLVSTKTKLVAFTLASNICGSLTNAKRIMAAAKSVGAMTYVDGVHYTPHFKPDVRALDCDFIVCSAYKFFGPHLGVLYGKSEHLDRLVPYKVEPASNDSPDRWETGTKSFEALAGFNATIEYLKSLSRTRDLHDTYSMISVYERQWSAAFQERASGVSGLKIYGVQGVEGRTPTFALSHEKLTPQAFSDHLARHNIITGASHFYATGVTDTLSLTEQGGVVRVGALHYNTIDELDRLFEVIDII